MGFRKATHSKIFVDESIPSFLTARGTATPTPQKLSDALPPPMADTPQQTSFANGLRPPPGIADRRNRPLKIRSEFLFRLIVVAIGLNGLLYVAFEKASFSQLIPQITFIPPTAQPLPVASPAPTQETTGIVSFSADE